MGKYDELADGRAITRKVREDIGRAGVTMSVNAQYDHLPVEYRGRIRNEALAAVNEARASGRQALAQWAESAAADARWRFASRQVGTSAEEMRRNTEELRVNRLVESARQSGTTRNAAADLAARADLALLSGDPDEAMVLARAAVEADPNGQSGAVARMIVDNVQFDRDLADPVRGRAMKDLRDIEVVVAAFDRDVLAATAQALQDSAALSRAIGDDASAGLAMKEAAEVSVRAKMEAFYGGQTFGDGEYREPVGVLPGGPLGNDPRGSARPDGATLPESRA